MLLDVRPRLRDRAGFVAVLALARALAPAVAKAETPAQAAEHAAGDDAPHVDTPKPAMIQYGVGFAAQVVADAGDTCAPSAPCILGSGGGLAARVGWRAPLNWYFGGAYEVAKLDSNKLYRLGLLHQVRAEARYYLETDRVLSPYAMVVAGAVAYGSEWSPDAFGPIGGVGVGASAEIAPRTLVGVALSYRVGYLSSFVDTAGTIRPAGVAQLVTLDFSLEARDPLTK